MPGQNPLSALEADEQQLLDAFEQGALTSVATPGLLNDLRQSACAVVISRPSAPGHCWRESLLDPDQQRSAQIREQHVAGVRHRSVKLPEDICLSLLSIQHRQ